MFQENATAYMVMEFLRGETLGQQLERIGKPMPEDELVALVEPLVDALDRIHDAGILHRDIKPDNVILAEIGGMRRPVLIDLRLVCSRLPRPISRPAASWRAHEP